LVVIIFKKGAKDFAVAVVFLYKDGNTTPMKISKYLALGFLVISLTPVFGQPTAAPITPSTQLYQQRLQEIVGHANGGPLPAAIDPATGLPVEAKLTKFNLDFPGGTPAQLVKAIEKAMHKPLNAIIPDEDSDTQLPSLKMNDVNVPQLFRALELASIKPTVQYNDSSHSSYSYFTDSYGFKTEGVATDASIWYFHVDKPLLPLAVLSPKVCNFYLLVEYLNKGLTVDDITTAIQTGWKMAGINPLPELNYHKETKLLIVFGEPNELKTIDDVLKALEKSDYKLPIDIDPNTGLPVTAEKPNAEKSGK
jgi:hypothetical protein